MAYDTKTFIEKAKKIHSNFYDYSKVKYINCRTDVIIICPIHGEFKQKPFIHLNGCGCKKCGFNKISKSKTDDFESFLATANKIHNSKYDYSKVKYIDKRTKICIICPIHGEFWTTPSVHLKGCECPKCSSEKNKNILKSNSEEFTIKANKIHNFKYDYSKVEYVNNKTKVCIVCPEHGEFWQTPNAHLRGAGCPMCNGRNKTTEQWVKECKEYWGDTYSYENTEYKGALIEVTVTCKKHGDFKTTPHNHIRGSGCPKCKQSHMEREVAEILTENNINFEQEKRFVDLVYKKKLPFDFYLPNHNIVIECQGLQHFKSIKFYGGDEYLRKRIEIDNLKRKYCQNQGIKIIYYSNYEFNFPYDVITDKYKLIKDILNE